MDTEPIATAATADLENPEQLTHTIVGTVADAHGGSTLDMQPLAQAVDPEALAALFRGDERDGSVTFAYQGYRVCVSGDGGVAVGPGE